MLVYGRHAAASSDSGRPLVEVHLALLKRLKGVPFLIWVGWPVDVSLETSQIIVLAPPNPLVGPGAILLLGGITGRASLSCDVAELLGWGALVIRPLATSATPISSTTSSSSSGAAAKA